MKFKGYYHETPEAKLKAKIDKYSNFKMKFNVWDEFVNSDMPDVTGDDFSVIPRVLPASYFPVIKRSAYLVTLFAMRLLSLPEREIRAIVPKGPVRDHLLDELQVVKFRPRRLTGSFRFDMAVVGPPVKDNPPKLLEINEIGFDGLARASFFQNVLLKLMPDVRGRLRSLDSAAAEVKNMQRLGKRMARIQYNSYNWDEEFLVITAHRLGSELRLITPEQFYLHIDDEFYFLERRFIRVKNGRIDLGTEWRPDAINMSFAYELQDYIEGHHLYRQLIRSKTPQYGPFISGLVAAKTVLVLLDDPMLRRRLLGSSTQLADSILPAQLLSKSNLGKARANPEKWVLKFTDGCGGEQVYMDKDLVRKLRRLSKRKMHEWVLQEKTALNLIDVNGLLSKPKQAISDLGVFVQYDWDGQRFRHFEVGGLMTRATNKSLKVNVSSGGLQVAVLLDRKS